MKVGGVGNGMGTKHGARKVDRPSRFTPEEQRERHLARARRGYPAANARKRERRKLSRQQINGITIFNTTGRGQK